MENQTIKQTESKPVKKSKTLTRIEELEAEKKEVSKQLEFWTEKVKQAEKFSEVLYQTRSFTLDFWKYRIKNARKEVEKEQGETKYRKLEGEVKYKTKFDIYYEALEMFDKEILEEMQDEKTHFDNYLWQIDSELEKLNKRLTRNKPNQAKQQKLLKKMNKHQEYLRNLQKEKWAIVFGRSNGNCQHPDDESYNTCGKYKKSILLTPVGGNQIVVPVGYAPRSELWICPKHLPFYQTYE